MRSAIIRCLELGRDISALQVAVPGSMVYESPRVLGRQEAWEASKVAHQTIVACAKQVGAPCVWVMEDDCQFTEYFSPNTWITNAMWAESNGYDVLIGGSTRTYDEKLVWKTSTLLTVGMIEVSAFHSSHCVVYFASGYEKVLRAGAPIDITLGQDEKARCVLTWPFVAVQRPSFSGCEGVFVDYVPLYAQHEMNLGARFGMRKKKL